MPAETKPHLGAVIDAYNHPETMACEFCGTRGVVAAYGCAPFEIPEVHYSNQDDWWAACAACSALIDHDSRILLLDRARELYDPSGGQVMPATARALVEMVQDGFWFFQNGEKRDVISRA